MPAYEKNLFWIVLLSLAGVSFLFFQFFYPYHLFFREQIQLFLYTPDYFLSYFSKPAWLTSYVGDFLTQFFYLRGGGAAILTLLFCMEWLLSSLVIKNISSTKIAPLWALFPVATDLILYFDLLHTVSISAGYILVLFMFLGYASISNSRLALAAGSAFTLTVYWFAGSMFILFPLLAIVLDFKQGKRSWMIWVLVAMTGISIPVLLRSYYLLTFIQAFIYPAVKLQSMLLPVSMIAIIMITLFLKRFEVNYQRILQVVIPLVLVVMLTVGIKAKANFNFEKILSLDSEYYFGNTDRVIELSKEYDLKSRSISYFTNMALAKKGLMPEYLLDFYQPAASGLILPVNPDENWQSIFVSNEVFFLMGDMNLAQHSAMLGNTFSPYQRSSRMIKRLAEINLINEDTAAANKYLRILTQTRFHKKWAESRIAMNHASALNIWLTQKRAQIPETDTHRKSNNYLLSLNFLVEQKPNNIIALDYLLCYHLLNKDLNAFIKVYDQYGRLAKRPVPSIYSEALLIKLYSAQASKDELANYAIPPQKINDFVTYTQLYDQSKGDLNTLMRRFGKSYWFYYHFATIQKK